MRLKLIHSPGSTLSHLKLDTAGMLDGRKMLFVHYGRELPPRALRQSDLYHQPGMLPLQSAASKAFEIIEKRGYDPSDYAAGFTHPNTNVIMALYLLEHPGARNWPEWKKERIKRASIYAETLIAPEGQLGRDAEDIHHAINQLITETSTAQGRGQKEERLRVVEEIVGGKKAYILNNIFDDPRFWNLAANRRKKLQTKMKTLKESSRRTDTAVSLDKGGKITVAHFYDQRYHSTHARLMAAEDAQVVLGESNQGHRLIEIGANPLNPVGRRIAFPPEFWQELRQVEAQNWVREGKKVAELVKDSPGGRENAGGTSRELDTLLTADQIIELIKKHATISRK